MKGDAQPLIKFFDGSDKRFIIPLYQRNYDWKVENCEQLFHDLIKLHNSDRKSHFFGSIVSSIQSGTEDRYIIDGQQRITTVSLLLIAMVNASNEVLYKPVNKYINDSNVTRNYKCLYNHVVGCGLTVDELFNVIKKLEVINIRLDEDDDPQLIFESLNSTGLDLSEADKIRNYLLMSLSPKEQESLYTAYWNPIEEATKYDPSSFVRDYLTMKQGRIGKIDKIYFIFKEYAESLQCDRTTLLSDMHHYAQIYRKIDRADFCSDKINQKINQVRTLDSTVAYPFYMAFFDYANSSGMGIDEQLKVLDIIESYWARRIICNLPSNALNKVFSTLHKETLNIITKAQEGAKLSYIEVLTYQLLKKGRSSVFPTDDEVKEDFCTRQVYKMPVNTRMFILERLENRDSKERHDVVKSLSEKEITIEHIMPQTLSEKWKQALGQDWERIHQQYLHTMANLTLTGYNSQYSNLTFAEKRDMEKGFNDSAFRLNNFVKSCTKWTEDEMKQRQSELLNVFMQLWPMPTTSFVPVHAEAESASLDDEDFEFTGKKLQAYVYRGVKYNVATWKEMLIQLCGHVLLEKRSTLEWLCANEKNGFSNTPESGRMEFSDGLYVWTDNSTSSKIWVIHGMFTECNIPYSELVFEFRASSEEASEE